MEDNKIKMPPPPKELKNMPAPPPKMPKKEDFEKKVDETIAEPVIEENVQQTEVELQEETSIKKESGSWKKIAYWAGFAASLVAMGILIYLLIK